MTFNHLEKQRAAAYFDQANETPNLAPKFVRTQPQSAHELEKENL
jgi:hypothetical protein